jgi:hypothetical protein
MNFSVSNTVLSRLMACNQMQAVGMRENKNTVHIWESKPPCPDKKEGPSSVSGCLSNVRQLLVFNYTQSSILKTEKFMG